MAFISDRSYPVIIDNRLLDAIEGFGDIAFQGSLYRHISAGRDPLAPSRAGGRWAPPGEFPILYTATRADIALAEWAYLRAQTSLPPSTPRQLWRIEAKVARVLDLTSSERLRKLDIDPNNFADAALACAAAGRAANFLGFKGILAPSARAPGANVMILFDNLEASDVLTALDFKEIAP